MGQHDRTTELIVRLVGADEGSEPAVRPGRVGLTISPEKAESAQAQRVLLFAVNVIARLFPVVGELTVSVPRGARLRARIPRLRATTVREAAEQLLSRLDPPLRWRVEPDSRPVDADMLVSVGPTRGATCYVDSDGWEAAISRTSAPYSASRDNPIGAHAAGCLAGAEVFKELLHPFCASVPGVPIIPIRRELRFSTFDYSVGGGAPNPAVAEPLDLDRLTLVGLGAGGGALAYSLAAFDKLQGHITTVEPDAVNDTNLNRYPFAFAADVDRLKTDVVAEMFETMPRVQLRSISAAYGDVSRTDLRPEDLRQVVSAVHSREARRQIQFDTPRILWDAAAEHGEFYVWRVVLGETLCMHCKHPPDLSDAEHRTAGQLHSTLGLSVDAWLAKIRDNAVFASSEVAAVASQCRELGVTPPREGEAFSDWEREHCGKLRLPQTDDDIPIPFTPVMAGVLLAGEVVKERQFPSAVVDSSYWNTLLGRFLTAPPVRRRPRTDCDFCSDPVYLDQFRRMWMSAPLTAG